MRGWLRAVWRELRHDAPCLSFPLVGVVTGILLWSHGSYWGAHWNLLGSELRVDVIVLGPMMLMLGVWHGGRDHRDGVAELVGSTRRGMLAGRSAAVAALALGSYAGVVAGWASAAWTIPLVGGWGNSAAFWYLAAMAPATAAYTAGGFALGRVLTWRIAAPVAGALGYLMLGYVVYNSDLGQVVAGMGDLGGSAATELDTGALRWSALGLAAMAIAAVGLGSGERRPAAARSWLALCVVAVVLAAATVPPASAAITAADRRAEAPYEPLVCDSSGGPRVCVYAGDRHWLGLATSQARAVIGRLRGIDGAPTWAGPLDGSVGSRKGMIEIDAGRTTPWGYRDTRWNADQEVVQVAMYFDPSRYCVVDKFGNLPGDRGGEAFSDGGFLVSDWALGQQLPDYDRLSRRFKRSSTAQRRAFASALLAAARSCDLAAARRADTELAAL